MFQCSYCNYESIYKYNVQRHEHVHNKNSTQNNIAPTTISVDSNVNNLLNQTKSGFGSVVTSPTTMYVGDNNPPAKIGSNLQQNLSEASSNIQKKHNSQYGTGQNTHTQNENYNEDYNKVVGIANGWK